ncbi:hypothetical protein [Streptosporangium sp. NPDC000396]|uniref:hypothetical protein n=1 Tax=Streptosporangium sp. NPDC000396 TaxID=3366185 RepID=UPI003679FC01
MGRHGGHGEDAPHSGGNHEPQPSQEADYRDEPFGRRLRPEESAITEPQTGFPGSGLSRTEELSERVWPPAEGRSERVWPPAEELPEQIWPPDEERPEQIWPPDEEQERRPGGRIKMALLAVVGVAVVLGGTVAGIQIMSSTAGSSTDCPSSGCYAKSSNQPETASITTEPSEEPEPTEDPVPSEEPKATKPKPTPSLTPSATRPRVGRTATAKPTRTPTQRPKATRAPRPTRSAWPTKEPESTPSPTDEPLVIDDQGHHNPTQSPSATTSQTAQPTGTAAPAAAGVAGAALTVGYDLVKQQSKTYTAKLVVVTNENLGGLALSLPVSGEVTSVKGAEWSQADDTLTLESVQSLEAGEDLVITFTAYGEAKAPRTCQSTQGECSIT